MSTGSETCTIETRSPEETRSLGEFVAKELLSGVLALRGPLGSGKTVFVKGLARGLGVEEDIASPTFVIEQVYEGSTVLTHVDAYRLRSAEELQQSGVIVDEYDGLVAVEWADRVLEALPPEKVEVDFEHTGERSRRITFRDSSGAHARLMGELRNWRAL